jgi:hypothetical protein
MRLSGRHPSRGDAALRHGHRLMATAAKVNSFRTRRAETSEFCKFFGFE